jgi:cell division septal protein FtsQ
MTRPPAARIARPFAPAGARARPAGSRRPSAARRARPRGAGALPGALAGALRSGVSWIGGHALLRRGLIALLICLPLLAGGYLVLRKSSFVEVSSVHVSGVSGPDAHAVESALVAAARRMSTLDVNTGALLAAVSAYPVVSQVHAYPRFPHGLRIVVSEQLPVASVTVGGLRTALAADGEVLGTGFLSSSLPTVGGDYLSSEGRVSSSGLLAALSVLSAEPAPLARLTSKIYTGPYGLTAEMKAGLLVYLGDASRPHAKWISLERVLVDQKSSGATSIDVRVPERPAASSSSASSASASSSTSAQGASAGSGAGAADSEATVAALAARLTEGESSSTSPQTSSAPAQASGTTEPASGAASETQSTTPQEQSSQTSAGTPAESSTGPVTSSG